MAFNNGNTAGPSVVMPFRQQAGEIFVGPGAAKLEAKLIGLGLSKLTSRQKEDLERARGYAMEESIKYVQRRKQIEHQQNQQKMARYTQTISTMARLYVGSISTEVREENLKQIFEAYGPIKSLNMCWDTATGRRKGYAFLEYEVPEAALLALKFVDGRSLGGRTLTVKPPTNMNISQAVVDAVLDDAKKYNRIYIASVHPDISESDLRTVFEPFGDILKVQLAKQHSGQGHRGFGYIEFRTDKNVQSALKGMQGFNLGGQVLQLGQCVTPPESSNYAIPTATAMALPLTSSTQTAFATMLQDFGPVTGSHGILAADAPDSAYNTP